MSELIHSPFVVVVIIMECPRQTTFLRERGLFHFIILEFLEFQGLEASFSDGFCVGRVL